MSATFIVFSSRKKRQVEVRREGRAAKPPALIGGSLCSLWLALARATAGKNTKPCDEPRRRQRARARYDTRSAMIFSSATVALNKIVPNPTNPGIIARADKADVFLALTPKCMACRIRGQNLPVAAPSPSSIQGCSTNTPRASKGV